MAVLLGLCDEQIAEEECLDSLNTLTNKIGGRMNGFTADVTNPMCPNCRRQMLLIVQMACPLDNSPYQRILCIFSCSRKECQNLSSSWLVLRCQQLDKAFNIKERKSNNDVLKTSDWCTDADDWGYDDDHVVGGTGEDTHTPDDAAVLPRPESPSVETNVTAEVVSKAERTAGDSCTVRDVALLENMGICNVLRSKCLKRTDVSDEANVSDEPFLACYLSAVEEPTNDDEVDDHVTNLLKQYEKREGAVTSTVVSGSTSEAYEKVKDAHGNETARKFMKRLSRCPEQCLRYSWQGEPLYVVPLAEQIRDCPTCLQKLTFEMQLMPALINYLKRKDNSRSCDIDFGTVLVFSCPNSCWTGLDTFREEQCIVQPDPDNELFS